MAGKQIRTGQLTWVVETNSDLSVDNAHTYVIEKLETSFSRLRNATISFKIDADGHPPIVNTRGMPSEEMERVIKEIFAEEDDPQGVPA